MAIRTRLIQSYPLSVGSGDLKAGMSQSFSVMDDSGAASEGTLLSARLTISRLRSYSENYVLEVAFDGVVLGRTENPGVFEDTRSIVLEILAPDKKLLTEPVFDITLTAADASGSTGNKLNYREQCYVTVEVDYQVRDDSNVSYWDGSRWLPCEMNYYNGSRWLPCETWYCPDGQTFQ